MVLWDLMALLVPKEKEVKKELWESLDPEGPTAYLGKMESLVLMASLVHGARRATWEKREKRGKRERKAKRGLKGRKENRVLLD